MGELFMDFLLCSDWTDKKMQQPSSLYGYYGMDVGSLSPLFAVDAKTGTIQGILEEDSFYKQALHFYFEATRENFWIRIREPRLLRNCRKSIRKDRFYFPVMRGRPESMEGQKQKRKNKATDISLL